MKHVNKAQSEPAQSLNTVSAAGGVTALGLLTTTLISIFVSETLVMFILRVLPSFPMPIEAAVDAALLALLVFPSLYFFSFRPLAASIMKHRRAEEELAKYHEHLEDLVQNRTLELSLANARLKDEVGQREQAEAELKAAHQRLVETVHSAAMAEVAAEALHNVRNVLNSINVSTSAIAEKVEKSELADLYKVADIINEHIEDIGTFFTEHPQGKHIPTYLAEVSKCLHDEQTDMIAKLRVLTENVQHIKDVINVQQSSARVSGIEVRTSLAQLVEDAIQINSAGLQRRGTRLVREFEQLPDVEIDKQRVLQIMVNLISNAKYALSDSKKREKLVTVRIYKHGEDRLRIEVADNGVGIPQENLTKIFSHGFTTKPHGHGFGLHSSALAAGELEGSLTVHSDGVDHGATFTLELPFKPAKVVS